MKVRIFGIILILISFTFFAACGKNDIENRVEWPIEKFSFTDHNGKSFGSDDLKGKVWVADFIFTNCPDICPPMTNNMAKLQQMTKDEGIKNIEFVSFSVDPEVDTPEALKKFGDKFNVDFGNFHFLTGYKQQFIEDFAKKNFKAAVQKVDDNNVLHQSYFYLVDKDGNIVKYYTGLNDIPFDEIIHDIKALQ